jgi:hypothetical protein
MIPILQELQTRSEDAKKHLEEATKAFQVAQQALQIAQTNFNIWNSAFQIELREEQQRKASAEANQLPLPAPKPEPLPAIAEDVEVGDDASEAINKTDVVRHLLHDHPAGMTAIEIWKQVGSMFKHRPYLYSVLKRLRDRDEVVMRRKKYCLKLATKLGEVKDQQQSVIH